MLKQFFKIVFLILGGEACPPPTLGDGIPLQIVLTYFAIDLPVGRFLLIGKFFDERCLEFFV